MMPPTRLLDQKSKKAGKKSKKNQPPGQNFEKTSKIIGKFL